jgi:hypothetical protein
MVQLLQTIVLDIKVIIQSFIKIAEVLITIRYDITRGHLWCHYSASSSIHSSSQLGEISPGQTTSPENNSYSKTEYTNTQQDLPDKLPLDMSAFGWWVCFVKKQLGSWILTFSILAQFLVRLSLLWWATNAIKNCTIQLIHAEDFTWFHH